ncbi:MAG: hypothetical protein M3R24_11915 [Chloroflexota bacterium]|nr:hypothetical protein [Chloroflexota bacterium]
MLVPLVVVILCTLTLLGCYLAFDRLQTRAEQTTGGRHWAAIGAAAGVGFVALCAFWACFAFSAGLLQALGFNLR